MTTKMMSPEAITTLGNILNGARPEQRQAIEAESPLVVVSAGAGTGKTFTLATRFAWLVATQKADVREILTLTFTEKAASEMLDRIRRILTDWYVEAPEVFPHLKQAIERLDEAYVSTIHAFSLRIIRELSFDLEVDPGSRLAGQADEETFWASFRDALDRGDTSWFQGLLEDESLLGIMDDPRLAALLNDFTPQALKDLVRQVVSLHGSLGRNPEDLLAWSEHLEGHDEQMRDRLLAAVMPQWQNEWALWQNRILPYFDENNAGTGAFRDKFLAFRDRWLGSSDPDPETLIRFVISLFVDLMGNLKGSNSKTGKQLTLLLGEATGTPLSLADYRDANSHRDWSLLAASLTEPADEEETACRKVLFQLSALGWAAWEGTKRLSGLMTFDDLIRRAIEALERRPDYANRFRHIMVDEFQDTDLRQKTLLESLWTPGRNALFLVGDLKQSIYRFRHADLAIFHEFIALARSRQAEGQGLYISLDCSFRSSEAVLAGVNSLFGRLWKEGLGTTVPHPYEPLEGPVDLAWWQERQNVGLPGVELLEEGPPATEDAPRPTAEEQRLFLSRSLARRIAGHIDTPVWDRRQGSHRPMRLKDIAVLVPRRTWYGSLEQAFQEEGLDAYFTGSRSYFHRGEFLDILALLRALTAPEETFCLAGYLASPFSGLDLDEALELLRENRTRTEEASPLLEDFERTFPEQAAEFGKLRRLALLAGPSLAVRRLLEKADNLLRLAPWTRRRAMANLKRAADILAEFESSRGFSLAGCAAYFGDVAQGDTRGEEPDVLGEEEDVIRVMTIHASKGLEFPLVALLGLEDNPRLKGGQSSSLIPSRHLGIVLGRLPGTEGKGTRSKLWHSLLEREELTEEHQRLFYVACTRAQDGLLLGARRTVDAQGDESAPPEGSWLSWIQEFYPLTPLQDDLKGRANRLRRRFPQTGIETLHASATPTAQRVMSATAYSLLQYCPHAYRMKYRQGFPLQWENPDEDGSGGPALGSLAHWILKHWDLTPEGLATYFPTGPKARERLSLQLPAELRPVMTDTGGLKDLRGWLEQFARSDLARRLRLAKRQNGLRRELPFTVGLAAGTLLVGAMDVAWKEDSTLHVADYKITALENVPGTLYDNQLLFYGLAAERGNPDTALELSLIHLRDNKVISLDTPSSWEDLERVVETAARQAAEGPFPPNPANCPRCPWRKTCPYGQN